MQFNLSSLLHIFYSLFSVFLPHVSKTYQREVCQCSCSSYSFLYWICFMYSTLKFSPLFTIQYAMKISGWLKVYLYSFFTLQHYIQVTVSCTPWSLSSQHTFYRTTEQNSDLDFICQKRPPPGIKPQFSFHPALSLLPIQTELYGVQFQAYSQSFNFQKFTTQLFILFYHGKHLQVSFCQKNVTRCNVCNH